MRKFNCSVLGEVSLSNEGILHFCDDLTSDKRFEEDYDRCRYYKVASTWIKWNGISIRTECTYSLVVFLKIEWNELDNQGRRQPIFTWVVAQVDF